MAKGMTNAICISGGGTLVTNPVTNIAVKKGNGKLSITWTDPEDNSDAAKWQDTTVRYKQGSIPTSATDGTLVVTETTRNQYQTTPLEITGLSNEKVYYITVFPRSVGGEYNTDVSQLVAGTPSQYSVWTVKIDQNNSNPETCCTYADDAVGMTKGGSEWDSIFKYFPCVMQNGKVVNLLKPQDFYYTDEELPAPISNTDYDVMIAFPRMGLSISTDENDVISVSLTNNPNDPNFQYLAHKRGSVQKDRFYLGAYVATGTASKVGSNSNAAPLVNVNLTKFIAGAHARGTGYEIMGFYQWTYIQALYVLKYGNLNSQAALGKGYVGGSVAQTTGATDQAGMCYGDPNSGTDRVKLFGLEDCWGNVYQWISGLYCDSSYNLLTTTDNFGKSTSASNWEYSVSSGVTTYTGGYMTKTQGTDNGGFVIKAKNGSDTTYFSDYGSLIAGSFPYVGGYWNDGDGAGVFYCDVNGSASSAYSRLGSRLMYL